MIPLLPAGRSRRSIAAIMASIRILRSGTHIALVALIVAAALLLPALTRSSGATAQTPDDDRAAAPPTLSALTATGEGRAMYPPFDPGTHHYAAGCGGGALTLSLAAAEGTRMAVNGVRQPDRDATVEMTGLSGDSDVVIGLDSDAGGSAVYTVHCLPDDFPTITARRSADASDILMSIAVRPPGYIAIIDTNGVPRFHRNIPYPVKHFQYHPEGRYPFSYLREDLSASGGFSSEAVVLSWDFRTVDVVRTVPPLTHTDGHDFVIKSNGNYVFMAYEPGQRDLSAFTDRDGNPYGTTERVRDSAIQEVTPEGKQVFLWNSWDHMAFEDCMQHRFPDDYAHINSIRIVDGDIVASFRGCSQVLRIDGTTGDTVWLLGKSNRDDADWLASGAPAPLKIAGDPYGEFCGQHAARLRPNGNLVLFDNGVHCLVDAATGASARAEGVFSRVVEYALDLESGQATFLRHYSPRGTFDRLSTAGGRVELLDNGNWLIGWGAGRGDDPATPLPPDDSITVVDPLTGREVLSITIANEARGLLRAPAYPVPLDALDWQPVFHLRDLEPGWNRIVWRGRDGVPVDPGERGALPEITPGGPISAIHGWDVEARSWLSFFPDSPAPLATNTLATLSAGERYWVAARAE